MIHVAYLTLVFALLAAGVAAVRTANLTRAAIAFCIGNSSLALLFFLMRAPYAGSVQLSVGAGLVSTLFIIAISLTESMRGGSREG
jgi:NADH:ubiquinone oxidoreductase subunit 6 (subunit J)